MAQDAPQVNHLLFADDSLLFFHATPAMAGRVESLLQTYCAASGQRINKDKSSIFFSKGCSESIKLEIKHTLDVQRNSHKSILGCLLMWGVQRRVLLNI